MSGLLAYWLIGLLAYWLIGLLAYLATMAARHDLRPSGYPAAQPAVTMLEMLP
jgi:hypothetical protein